MVAHRVKLCSSPDLSGPEHKNINTAKKGDYVTGKMYHTICLSS